MTREELVARRSLLLAIKAEAEEELASIVGSKRRGDILKRHTLTQTVKSLTDGYWLTGKDHERELVHGDQGRAGDLPARLAAKGLGNDPESMRLGLVAIDRDIATIDAPPPPIPVEDVNKMIEAAVAPLRKRAEELEVRLQGTDTLIAQERRRADLARVAAESDVLPAATEDFILRAERTLAGEKRYSPKRPWEPMTLPELAVSLRTDAPHLFRPARPQAPAQRRTPDGRLIVPKEQFGQYVREVSRGEVILDDEQE